METTRQKGDGARAELGLWDATSIIVGIMIGVGIFETPQEVFQAAPGPWQAMSVWALGGVLALVGALCFAELASAYPQSGGEYVYLTRAFGPMVGYLFGWAQIAVIRPASIGGLAYIFADRAHLFIPWPPLLLAVLAVGILTVINIGGANLGANTQNVLTAAKVLGLTALVLWLFHEPLQVPVAQNVPAKSGWFAILMFPVLFTYAGWNEAAYIAAEVKNSRKNLPLALILGTSAVTVIYLLVNGGILLAVGFETAGARKPSELIHGDLGKAVNLMIMVSALGAINGMIFTTARISSAFGQDHRVFRPLGHWSKRGTPVRSLLIQGIVNVGYLVGAEIFSRGPREVVIMAASLVGLGEPTTSTGPLLATSLLYGREFEPGPMESLQFWIYLTAPVFWLFFLLTGLALLVLRIKEPQTARPFHAPLYPLLPILFCGWCAYMVYEAVSKLPKDASFGFAVLLAGLPLYFLPKKKDACSTPESPLVQV